MSYRPFFTACLRCNAWHSRRRKSKSLHWLRLGLSTSCSAAFVATSPISGNLFRFEQLFAFWVISTYMYSEKSEQILVPYLITFIVIKLYINFLFKRDDTSLLASSRARGLCFCWVEEVRGGKGTRACIDVSRIWMPPLTPRLPAGIAVKITDLILISM